MKSADPTSPGVAGGQAARPDIDPERLPRHIAIIMDGNGRWARAHGYVERIRGHEAASEAVRSAVRGCGELGVGFLTLYAFSTENWNRPAAEVAALMKLLERFVAREIEELDERNVRLVVSGELERLPGSTRRALDSAVERLAPNTGLTVNLALSYGGRQEILRAARRLARAARDGEIEPGDISEADFAAGLYQPHVPDPDLLIRTSGEMRVSNFLLWQIAYTEIVVLPVFWPDFRQAHLHEAIAQYQKRDRRYGGVAGRP